MAPLRQPGPLWSLALSQLALGGLLAVCVAAEPGFVLHANEGGVSNYGTRTATVVPYTLAFALCALLLRAGARSLPASVPGRRRLAAGMEASAVGYAAVLASTYPYKVAPALDDLHLGMAVLLFSIQFAFVTWLAFVACPRWAHAALWLLWFAGFALGGATLVGLVHLLFVAQVTMTVGFALLTVVVTARLLDRGGTVPSSA